jgi:hypothetical protein
MLYGISLMHRTNVFSVPYGPANVGQSTSFTFADAISSCSFRVLFAEWTYELSTNCSLSRCARDPLLLPYNAVILVVYVRLSFKRESQKDQTKKPLILLLRTKSVILSCCHLHSLISHDTNLSKYVFFLHTLNPITVVTGKVLLSLTRFLLAAPGPYSRLVDV